MVARGRVKNGVVVLEDSVRLPEGTAVTVVPEAVEQPVGENGGRDRTSEEERRRILEIMEEILEILEPANDAIDEEGA